MDPLSIVASTLSVIQAISSTYKGLQHLKNLPNEFDQVHRNLPVAQDTLELVRDQLRCLPLDGPAKNAIQPMVTTCKEKADMIQKVFQKVEARAKRSKTGSVLDSYRASLLRLGKAHRVETLMQEIMTSLDTLATNQLFKTATQSQVAEIKTAIEQLSRLRPSVPDSELGHGKTDFTQHIGAGATGQQSQYSGRDQKVNSGSGNMYNYRAESMHFAPPSETQFNTRSDILQALYTSPYLDRKNRNPDRIPGTCEWFADHDHFQQWRQSKSSSMLWVSANPGCGKSVLAKYLVDELKTASERTVCYFFFKDDFEDQKSARSALSCILHQLLMQREDLFSNKIVHRFESLKTHLTNTFDELWDVLITVSQLQCAGEIVCILDAFDECDDQERRKLSQALRTFYDTGNDIKNSVKLKFLVTSRPYDRIGRGFQPLNIPGLPIIHLKGESDVETTKIAKEIDIYIQDRVSRIHLGEDEEQLLLQELRRIPNQTYLWVYLTLESIEEDLSISKTKIKDIIYSLPPTVDDAYERILAKSSDATEAKRLLHIVVAAARPLTLAEMDLALALQHDLRSYQSWDQRPEDRFGKYIRDLCGLFVTITTDSKIYLLHQTVKEFLVPKHDSPRPGSQNHGLMWKSSLKPQESHRILCQICIWHLLFIDFDTHLLERKQTRHTRDHVWLPLERRPRTPAPMLLSQRYPL